MKYRFTKTGAAGGVACLLTLFGQVALAAPESADELVERGVKLRVEGNDAKALEVFTRAHALSPSARTTAQIGLAEGALHRWLDAEAHLSTALAQHDTPWIENRRNREALEQALASVRSHIGTITVTGPEGTEVVVEGKRVGRLPLNEPLRLPEGPARIEASAAGRRPAAAEITVAGGLASNVILDLPLLPPPAPVAAALPPPSLNVEASSPSGRWKTWTGASLLGFSAAALATGIVWLAVDSDPSCSAPSGTVCKHLYDTKTQGWIAVGAGAAAGVTGAILVWRGRRADTRIGIRPGGVTATLRF